LADIGYDPDFGARPLKRAIQRELQDPLALEVLSGSLKVGDLIRVEAGSDGLIFTPVQQDKIKAEI
jgi:ATP-dependent Clp protease ATP-binding subunit ClpB